MTGTRKIIYLLLFLSAFMLLWKTYQYFSIVTKDIAIKTILHESKVVGKIKVSIYYEALCSDSRNFFNKQLVPIYDDLQNYLELDLIPYGKAKTIEKDGVITFTCQHAAVECLANKIHACGLLNVKDQNLQFKYISCMIKDNMIPYEIAEKCAKQLEISFDPILECAHSEQASLLLKEYGKRTKAVNPPIGFIPTIELNDNQDIPLTQILKTSKKFYVTS